MATKYVRCALDYSVMGLVASGPGEKDGEMFALYECPNCDNRVALITEDEQPATTDSEQPEQPALFSYPRDMCEMCGGEGATPKSDGHVMHTRCWQIWNS